MILLKIKITILLFVSSIIQITAQAHLPIASENIVFEINFDSKDTGADISVGKPDVTATLGRVQLKKSPWGTALYCGANGAKLRYKIKGNVDFSGGGTVILWFKPLNWRQVSSKHPRVFFFGVESSKGFLGVQISNGPKSRNILERKIRMLLLYFKAIPATIMNLNDITPAGDNRWQMLAITWSKNELGLSLNGAPFAIKKIAGELKQEYFTGRSFSLGSNVGANYLLDMFRIYNRRLADQELKDIYLEERKSLKN